MPEDTRAADVAAVQEVLADSYRAWEAGDADAMVGHYTADATAVMPGSLRDGREAVRSSMAQGFAGPLKGTSTWNRTLSLRFLGRDAAVLVSESGILFGDATEVPPEQRVHATWVLERQDGRWLIAAYHNSPVLTPAH